MTMKGKTRYDISHEVSQVEFDVSPKFEISTYVLEMLCIVNL